jgi:hypothetical protein
VSSIGTNTIEQSAQESRVPMFEITGLAKSGGPLTKRIYLDEETGKPISDGSACLMASGGAGRLRYNNLSEFAVQLTTLDPNEGIALGRLRHDLADVVKVVTQDRLQKKNGSEPDIIARTSSYIAYATGLPALALIDVDTKGMPPEVKAKIDEAGGFWAALVLAFPDLANTARVVRTSTSSGISRNDTGEVFPGSNGLHIFLLVKDGADVDRFLKVVHERCWIAGLGWHWIGAAGQFLDRSPIDRMVGAGERIVFEGPPQIEPPLVQDRAARTPKVFEGAILDTREAFPQLTPDERDQIDDLKAASAARLKPQADAVCEEFVEKHAEKLAADKSIPIDKARYIIRQQTRGILLPDAPLPWDLKKFEGCTARDILANPAKFIGQTMADPLEGVAYGRCKAKVYQRRDGSLIINSHAHGGKIYEIRPDEPPPPPGFDANPDDPNNWDLDDPRWRDGPDEEPPPGFDDPGYRAAQDAAAKPDPVEELLAEFNRKYMVVNETGKALIYEPSFDPILGRKYYLRIVFGDLQKFYLNRIVQTGVDGEGNPVFEPVARVWLHHPKRRQYLGGIVFDPSGKHKDRDVLNLWQEFAVKPGPGSWMKMKEHILNVVCSGNREFYDYVLNWSARMIQFPDQRGEVAIVMKGVEGAGKGIFANALRHIIGHHSMKISNAKHLVGNFNLHLRDCVFLFADEAFYAGDKQHVGVLKSIITEDSLTIEGKNANVVEAPNFLHLMMSSNEDWVVPAGPEARRFMVLLVANTKVKNFAYFKAVHEEMDNGGYGAMMHELMHRDLTGFNVRDVPDTEGLREQKKLSLGTSDAWWLDVLHRGYVYKSKLGLEDYFGEWHETITTEVLFTSYTEFAKAKNERHPMSREFFGQFMVKMGGEYTQPRNAVVGEHITDATTGFGNTSRQCALVRKDRATGYKLRTLQQARAAFFDATNLPVEWEEDKDG